LEGYSGYKHGHDRGEVETHLEVDEALDVKVYVPSPSDARTNAGYLVIKEDNARAFFSHVGSLKYFIVLTVVPGANPTCEVFRDLASLFPSPT
jgi:hypothetical protein